MEHVRYTSVGALAFAALAFAALAAMGAFWLGATRLELEAQPAPAPSAATISDAAVRGKVIYEKRCVECHGVSGRGDGPASPLLMPRPQDFTGGKFKIRSTESGSVPTDEDLIRSVRQGLYGSAMPAWETLLSAAEISDVVEYVKTFVPRFKSETSAPVVPGAQVPSSPESITRGRQVYETLQCSKCHGSDGRGAGAVATEFQDDWQLPLAATDLTEPWTFHGGATARDIYLRFRTGMSGTPMPSFKDSASDSEMWDLANYVVSLGRKPVWSMTVEEITARYAWEAAEAKRDPIKRGKYLVDTMMCSLCHSPIDKDGRVVASMKMAGGQLFRIVPFGDYPTANLTSDEETGLGKWTDDEIRRVMTQGIRRDGTRLLPFPMDWPSYAALKAEDLNAIIRYLRTIPPTYNRVPAPSRPFLPMYLWGKFKMLILQQDPPLIIYPGNAGATSGGRS